MSISSNAGAIARATRIAKLARHDRVAEILYNGSVFDPIYGKYDGRAYTIPPDGETSEHCQQDPKLAIPGIIGEYPEGYEGAFKFDGTLKVYDVYGAPPEKWVEYRKRKKQTPFANIDPPTPTIMLQEVANIVGYLAASFEDRGLIILTGDPEKDKARKKKARQIAMDFDIERCQKVLAGYHKRCELFRAEAGNRGKADPLMNKLERGAQGRLDSYATAVDSGERLICPVRFGNEQRCGYFTEGKDRSGTMKLHMEKAHPMWKPETDQEQKDAAKIGQPTAEASAPKPKRRKGKAGDAAA